MCTRGWCGAWVMRGVGGVGGPLARAEEVVDDDGYVERGRHAEEDVLVQVDRMVLLERKLFLRIPLHPACAATHASNGKLWDRWQRLDLGGR